MNHVIMFVNAEQAEVLSSSAGTSENTSAQTCSLKPDLQDFVTVDKRTNLLRNVTKF